MSKDCNCLFENPVHLVHSKQAPSTKMVFGHHGALGPFAKGTVEMANKAEVGPALSHKVAKIALAI